ncbi:MULTISPECIES: glutamine--fructose-6-phosphate transaminase (isomerizing) [Blastomonas]|jgi:glucosamine--fructose-6-phosphate aminotransferase (isomerizing)|uniref:glutamine--fructose-6-phosphate transaminase (isomerizing) n=1 Tax=Blastomonas TaxID=150203 RepID=UPI0006B9243C|nr:MULTISPECIES: glutamine--fructose-6-phosphate transaminase (isomerizing) [Blastomonas]KPF76839.1 glucosamine--fructose-6-phosphate aminotransferase [Blastomonas sp. AAP25]MDK2757461.1 glutamine--fructose-6-phosphate transaminase (isomerizing) [Blastomonas fulva]MDM7929258.1 glutamine--fructose-6-phosphate transaminase (isomerizing) [Blastomonas fulva]MDM7966028.1 glutamine--fructose-6-phosphate transaminase (isomerizing) [Blastomonas fulva]
MCGIVGILARRDVVGDLVDGLKRMEYRGYDSAGVCTVHDGQLVRRRAQGKLRNLVDVLAKDPAPGHVGIAHTRWATHGAPTTSNAHPHATDEVALVHNGIIENFKQLRDALIARGRRFESETDSEVVAHLLSERIEAGDSPQDAVKAVLPQLRGAFALAIAFRQYPDMLIGARLGSPLVLGYGEGETYLGSDALALAPLTQRIAYLEEGDWVVLTRDGAQVFDADNAPVEREVTLSGVTGALIDKGNHRHFMQKEIFEQPVVVAQTLQSYIRSVEQQVALPQMDFELSDIDRVTIIACGTASYVGMIGKYWIEQLARVPVEVDVASEYRYRDPVLSPGMLGVVVSQSGETADTLAALRHMKAGGVTTAGIINVPTSSMAREVDLLLPTHAGPEIGVASTKAFTCQLAVMAALAVNLARAKGRLSQAEEAEIVRHLIEAPAAINAALAHDAEIEAMAHTIAQARDVLYLGRGPDYALALEGALKLKEISYIHAEGYAAGEMKHGPIALIDEAVPIIVIAPSGPLFEKTVSNMQEVRARGGKVVLISDAEGLAEAGEGCLATIEMPKVHPLIAPLVYAVPVQLLAYHVAVAKGTDVDQPRNLAKSVTVE